MQNPFYKKEYLPGYTGHVPRKNDLYGVTAGDANQILITPNATDNFFSGAMVVKPSNLRGKAQLKTSLSKKNRRNSAMRTTTQRDPRMKGVLTGVDGVGLGGTSKTGKAHKLFGRNKSVGSAPDDRDPAIINEVVKYNNKSKLAKNWICGPTHEV
jgi:hypothetical protein